LDEDIKAPEAERLTRAKSRLHDELWRSMETAIKDAQALGYGFVAIKKGVGTMDLSVRHLPWHLVIDCLKDMGALGAVGGVSHKSSPKVEELPP